MDGRYLNGTAKAGNINIPLEGNKIESVPDWNLRNGIQFIHKTVQLSLLHSFVSKSFADPLNTIVPPESTAAVGIVPSYTLLDMNASVTIKSGFIVKLSLNNMCNRQYFTKRPMFYPGPGIWPSDGRNFTITTILKW
jgi:Fe(3+) dicitrate transport protein